MATTKILAHLVVIVIVGAAGLIGASARTVSLEKDSVEMQKTFFHPFFPPALGHRGGGKIIPGFTGVQPGFPSGAAGSTGTGGAVGSRAGDRFGSTSGGTEGAIASTGGEDNTVGASGNGIP